MDASASASPHPVPNAGPPTTDVTLSVGARTASVLGIWVLAGVAVLLIALLVPAATLADALSLSIAGCVVIALAVQLATRQKRGFVARLAASVAGAAVILGVAAAVFALTPR